MKETVSVILTTYNSESTLQRALDSIFAQEGLGDLFALDLIVVDDCSKDDTRKILSANNIDYYSTAHNSGGPNKGRNIGLDHAKGSFICIMDHDDEWLPNKLKTQLFACMYAPIISSGYWIFDTQTQNKSLQVNTAKNGGLNHYAEDETFKTLLTKSKKGQKIYFGSLMFAAELKKHRFEEHFGKVDFDWLLRIFNGQKSVEICEALYNRYVDGHNLSLNPSYRSMDFYYSLMCIENYQQKYPSETKLAYKRIHGTRARYYYLIGDMPKARFYFTRSDFNWKTVLYYLTTFAGSAWVKKKFKVF
jgi:glycosyltransferase involved in cell wall biosynthesis